LDLAVLAQVPEGRTVTAVEILPCSVRPLWVVAAVEIGFLELRVLVDLVEVAGKTIEALRGPVLLVRVLLEVQGTPVDLVEPVEAAVP